MWQRFITHRAYWLVKARIKYFNFIFWRKKYWISEQLKAGSVNVLAFSKMLREAALSVVLAIIIAVILQITNSFIAASLHNFGFSVPKDGDYATFLSAVAGICGVFIGLYYAALTSVGSAIYAKTPNNIRALFSQERSGNVYMRFLSTLALLCITLLAARVIGFDRILIAIPIVAAMAGVGIISFVKLGKNAFNLFDPTSLSHHVFDELHKCILNASVGGYRWNDSAFQNYANTKANNSIDTLKALLMLASQDSYQNNRQLVRLCCQVLIFLSIYEKSKKQIPSYSYWYPQKFQHRDWYSSPGHTVTIAHRTGTALEPELIRDFSWLEFQLHPEIMRVLSKTIQDNQHLQVIQLLNASNEYIRCLVSAGRVNYAYDFADNISQTICELLNHQCTESFKGIEKLSVIEALSTFPITIALELNNYAVYSSIDNVAKKINKIDWTSERSLYLNEASANIIYQLEWIQSRIKFEIETEGFCITPHWYQLELVALAQSKIDVENYLGFVNRSIKYYKFLSENFNKSENCWFKACVQSREFEFWHKADRTLDSLQLNWETWRRQRILQDLPWPTLDFDSIDNDISLYKTNLIQSISSQIEPLSRIGTPTNYPDYTGQFCLIAGEYFLKALCENDEKLAKEIFQTYILGCIFRFEKLKPISGEPNALEFHFRIAAAALLDVIELSGYAKLLSELHGNEALWTQVASVWSRIIGGEAGHTVKAYLSLVFRLNGAGHELPLRSEIRFDWKNKVENLLNQLPRESLETKDRISSEIRAVHSSALIRAATTDNLHHNLSGLNLFVIFYYCKLTNIDEFELNWQQQEILRAVDNERNTNATAEGKTDE